MTPTVTAMIADQARRQPSAPAIHYNDSVISYADLELAGKRAARGLADLGVGPGDRVALWLPTTPAFLFIYLGLARLGAIAVSVNTRFRGADVGDIIGRSGAKVLVLWPDFRGIDFLGILEDVDPAALDRLETVLLYTEGANEVQDPALLSDHIKRVAFTDLMKSGPSDQDNAQLGLGSNIFTTSGTTKAPKFVLHSQSSMVTHGLQIAEDFGLAVAPGPVLVPLPLCGVFGFTPSMAALAGGCPLVLMSSFEADRAVELVRRLGVVHANLSDTMILAMLDAADGEVALPSMRFVGYGQFDPNLDNVVERGDARGLSMIALYGMSEVQALFSRRLEDEERRGVGGGRPVSPEGRVRVRDPDSGELLGVGETGELEVYGPSRMIEYFENPQATRDALYEDGFMRTGDLGFLEDDGGFTYLARMGDELRLGGFLTAPAEIEDYLRTHPMVDGCQVVGADTPSGLGAVGFITLAPGHAFQEALLIEHCRQGLARYKTPARIIPLEDFPVTLSANGTKIQRVKLREMAQAEIKKQGETKK